MCELPREICSTIFVRDTCIFCIARRCLHFSGDKRDILPFLQKSIDRTEVTRAHGRRVFREFKKSNAIYARLRGDGAKSRLFSSTLKSTRNHFHFKRITFISFYNAISQASNERMRATRANQLNARAAAKLLHTYM